MRLTISAGFRAVAGRMRPVVAARRGVAMRAMVAFAEIMPRRTLIGGCGAGTAMMMVRCPQAGAAGVVACSDDRAQFLHLAGEPANLVAECLQFRRDRTESRRAIG